MKDKQEITKVMLLTLTYEVTETVSRRVPGFWAYRDYFTPVQEKVEKHVNYVLPLDNFDLIEESDSNKLVLKAKDLKLPKRKLKRATLSLTNDPRITWASDWSDLGCFRLVYKLFKPKAYYKGNKLVIESPKTEKEPGRDRDITIPDRKRWM